jgi:hypothetical protein
MALRRRLLTSGIVLLAVALPAAFAAPADSNPASSATPRPYRLGPKAKQKASEGGPEVENVRKALEALTPEQRLKFKDNFIRWINLSPDEKRNLREREESRKKRMVEETETAIRESGLTLDPGQRAKFAKRYAEERRKIEERLRQEVEEKRRPLVAKTIEQLRAEFAASAAVAATPVPAR